jgi:prepilin-type N-terminal cleavage/methylation domain-containing protein/prepilin-type processing-associated H-X9-DG protein
MKLIRFKKNFFFELLFYQELSGQSFSGGANPLKVMSLSIKRYSLVEVLVVLSILSILASLLTPALKKSIEQANVSRCKSNLKSQVMALHLYLDDYNQYFFNRRDWEGQKEDMVENKPLSSNYPLSAYKIYDAVTANSELQSTASMKKYKCKENWQYGSSKPHLMGYGLGISHFICPTYQNVDSNDNRDAFTHAYAMSFAFDGHMIGQFKTPPDRAGVFMDGRKHKDRNVDEETSDMMQIAAKMSARHDLNVMVGFLDGHVEGIFFEEAGRVEAKKEYFSFEDSLKEKKKMEKNTGVETKR